MNAAVVPENSLWAIAALAASLFAIDPIGAVGVAVRAPPGAVRDRWLALVRELLPPSTPMRRVPFHVTDSRLLGGLDLAATLQAGRPVAERGILAEADGGVVVLAMAERLTPATAARIAAVLDVGAVKVERDGLALRLPARFGVIAFDEGLTGDEGAPAALLDRLALHIDLTGIGMRDIGGPLPRSTEIVAARARLPAVLVNTEVMAVLGATASALGIGSLRAPLLALRLARAAAALDGRGQVSDADAALAGRLVFASRTTAWPSSPEENAVDQTKAGSEPSRDDGSQNDAMNTDRALEDVVLAAVQAAIPASLLTQLRYSSDGRSHSPSTGRAGALRHSARRGRPAGVRRGELRTGARLNVVETLRAAAPWQTWRRGAAGQAESSGGCDTRINIRRDDFRITRFKQRAQTTIIFAVDASGSSALHRLAEAKGAVELLLADCYVRRDRVALIAFRGRGAELVLPPTRSLVRAKRSLAALPGGGGTPLAAGIDAAVALADGIRRRGDTPVIVVLTDGRANVARDGDAGHARAEEDALTAARRARAAGLAALMLDTAPRPQLLAQRLAAEMGARYLPLPYADAAALSQTVRTAMR